MSCIALVGSLASLGMGQSVASVTFDPPLLGSGANSQVMVTLDAPAPAGGLKVNLSSNKPLLVVPSFVRIPAGRTSAEVTASSTGPSGWAQVTATRGVQSKKARIRISSTLQPWAEAQSVGPEGNAGNGHSGEVSDFPSRKIGADGRFSVYVSEATNLIAGDTNRKADVFVHDRMLSLGQRAQDYAGAGFEAMRASQPTISGNGQYVAFVGDGTIYLWELATNTFTVVASGNDESFTPAINSDGRFVAFASYASNLVSGDTNGCSDIFFWRKSDGVISRVSVTSANKQGNGDSFCPALSDDGTQVVFESDSSNFGQDKNWVRDVFVRDRTNSATTRMSVSVTGTELDQASFSPSVSGDGTKVAFTTYDAFEFGNVARAITGVRNRAMNSTTFATPPIDSPFENDLMRIQAQPTISSDGMYVAFKEQYYDANYGTYYGNRVRVMDADTGELLSRLTSEFAFSADDMSISGDGRWMLTSTTSPEMTNNDGNGMRDVFLMELIPNDVRSVGFNSGFLDRLLRPTLVGEGSPYITLYHPAPTGGAQVLVDDNHGYMSNIVTVPAGQLAIDVPGHIPGVTEAPESTNYLAVYKGRPFKGTIRSDVLSVEFQPVGPNMLMGTVTATQNIPDGAALIVRLYRNGSVIANKVVFLSGGHPTETFSWTLPQNLEPGWYASDATDTFNDYPGKWFLMDF